MSKTLNRPMFKRGPDGQMRQAKFIGGILRAAPQVYRAAKYYAPKFSNIPYNINRMVNPRAAGIQNPVVGKTGPRNFAPLNRKGRPGGDTYDFRLQEWSGKLNNLRNKHNLTALEASGVKGVKGLPQEVIDHWKAIPKMPGGRKITEQLAYPFTYSMLDNWTTDHSEAASNVDVEAGSTVETETAEGVNGQTMTFTFSGDSTFSMGDLLRIGIELETDTGDCVATSLFKYDTTK